MRVVGPILYILGTVGLSIWIMMYNFRPANRLIKLQLDWFDGYYYPKITFGLVWGVIILTTIIVFNFIAMIASKFEK